MDGYELKQLINGVSEIFEARGTLKEPVKEEISTMKFAFASVVATREIKKGEKLTKKNIFPKRPGIGDYLAKDYKKIIGKKAKNLIKKNSLVKKADIL